MTTLTAPTQASTATPGPPGSPRLRVRREGRPDQTIEVPGAKCTIGSSSRCHVRLPASESQPLECLLSLETGAAIVTRWASGALLNGRPFAKQEFQAGDTLSIGPWEIEWEGRAAVPRGPVAGRRSTQRETIDFTPPAVEPPTQWLRTNEPFVPRQLAVESAPPSPTPIAPPRPAAKTLLMASRQTDPFDEPLGPSSPTITAPTAPVALSNVSSQTFEDRLVAKLWTANFTSRRRAKAIASAARTARARADKLASAVTTAEQQLTTDRSANESATAALRLQLESLRSELNRAVAERDSVAVELEATRKAPRPTATPDPRLQILADAVVKAEREAADLRDALAVCNEQIDALRQQCDEAESALAAAVAAQSLAEKGKSAAELQLAELQIPAEERQRVAVLAESDAREQQRLVADQEATELRDALAACNEQIKTLTKQCTAADAALSAATAAQATAEKARSNAERQLAELRTAAEEQEHASLLAERELHERQRLAAQNEAAKLSEALAERNAELDALREQYAAAELALAAATAEDDDKQATSDFEQQLAELQAVADKQARTAVLAERTAREQERLLADQEAARLREQLYACETQIETLRSQLAEGDAARAELDDRLAETQQQQEQWLSQCQALESDHAEKYAEATAERDELRRQLDALESQSPVATPPAAAITPSPFANWSTPTVESSEADAIEDEIDDAKPASWRGWDNAGHTEVDADAVSDVNTYADPSDDEVLDLADVSEAVQVEQAIAVTLPAAATSEPAPAPTPERVATPYSPPSFIDKYRHMLDDEGGAEPRLSDSRPILDEEHMSPLKAILSVGHDDDSDEALEAYMSNMMRRVRGDGSVASQGSSTLAFMPQHPADLSSEFALTPAIAEEAEPEIEVDANGMLRLVRKQHAATDMTALRELANSSARTAIAHHHKRRHVQSALAKGVVFALASAASAYLMLTAKGVDSPWFWGGCVTLVMAVASAAQLAVLTVQRIAERRRAAAERRSRKTAPMPTPEAPLAE